MINIVYYISKNDVLTKESIEMEVFKTISEEEFRQNYKLLKGSELITNVYYIDVKNPVFENRFIEEEYNKNNDLLPVVLVNNEIVCKKNILPVKDLSKLLDIGLSVQNE